MDKAIIFRGTKITRAKSRNNILRVLSKAKDRDKFDWYQEANSFCQQLSDKYDIPKDKVIGIVSALSPMRRWDINKRDAEYYISTDKTLRWNDKLKGYKKLHTTNQVNKCIRIRNTDDDILTVLGGPKTKSFYMNIKYPAGVDNVTIDRHAIAVALGRIPTDEEHNMTDKAYRFFVDVYKWTAEGLGMKPLLLQSITWEVWRKIK